MNFQKLLAYEKYLSNLPQAESKEKLTTYHSEADTLTLNNVSFSIIWGRSIFVIWGNWRNTQKICKTG
jgi:hypothetical protein